MTVMPGGHHAEDTGQGNEPRSDMPTGAPEVVPGTGINFSTVVSVMPGEHRPGNKPMGDMKGAPKNVPGVQLVPQQ